MTRLELEQKLPGYLATGLLTIATTLWTFWGVGEMYYEGWWGGWYNQRSSRGGTLAGIGGRWIANECGPIVHLCP